MRDYLINQVQWKFHDGDHEERRDGCGWGVDQGGYESWIPDATYQLYFPQRLNLNEDEEVLIE